MPVSKYKNHSGPINPDIEFSAEFVFPISAQAGKTFESYRLAGKLKGPLGRAWCEFFKLDRICTHEFLADLMTTNDSRRARDLIEDRFNWPLANEVVNPALQH